MLKFKKKFTLGRIYLIILSPFFSRYLDRILSWSGMFAQVIQSFVIIGCGYLSDSSRNTGWIRGVKEIRFTKRGYDRNYWTARGKHQVPVNTNRVQKSASEGQYKLPVSLYNPGTL